MANHNTRQALRWLANMCTRLKAFLLNTVLLSFYQFCYLIFILLAPVQARQFVARRSERNIFFGFFENAACPVTAICQMNILKILAKGVDNKDFFTVNFKVTWIERLK